MKFFKVSKKLIPLIVIVAMLVLILPQHQAKASGFLGLGCVISTSPISTCIYDLGVVVATYLGDGISFFAKVLDGIVAQTFTFPAQVYNAWRVMRDFMNMFFILVLIVMAFGTIFNLQKYNYSSLLKYFLVSAILINFSFTIGQYLIYIGNGLGSIFLGTIQSSGSTLSDSFMNGLAVHHLLSMQKTISGDNFSMIFNIFTIIVMFFFALIAMLSAAIFTLVRIPFIWFLLIVSPVAWFGFSLPSIKGRTWTAWWHQFIGWVFFLPAYLFFLMFGMVFINGRAALGINLANPPQGTTLGNFFQTFGLNDLFMFVVTLIFMIGGLGIAFKLSFFAGTQADVWMKKVEGGVKRYFPGSLRIRSTYEGAKEGVKAKATQIQERGITGRGGEQAARLRSAQWAETFGFGANRGAGDKALIVEINKEKAKIDALKLSKDQLKNRISKAGGPELAALRLIQAENGWLGPSDTEAVKKQLITLGGGKTVAGKNYLTALQNGGFEKLFTGVADKEAFVKSNDLDTPELIELKKTLLRDMAKNKEIVDDLLVKQTVDLFRNESKEIRGKVFADLQNNLMNIYPLKDMDKALSSTGGWAPPIEVKKMMAKLMAEKKKIVLYKDYKMALDILGGESSFEGHEFIGKVKEYSDFQSIEHQFRKELSGGSHPSGLPARPDAEDGGTVLNDVERSRLTDEFETKLGKMDIADIKKMPAEVLEMPEMQTAINRLLPSLSPRQVMDLYQGVGGEKRAILDRARRSPSPSFVYS